MNKLDILIEKYREKFTGKENVIESFCVRITNQLLKALKFFEKCKEKKNNLETCQVPFTSLVPHPLTLE